MAQNDIKKVLAYSTISQLGFMFAALGIGAYVAATFHLLTHAFFKALLFLGSGSVIHGMEHGHHEAAHAHSPARAHAHEVSALDRDTHTAETSPREEHGFDPQDMRNMGGLVPPDAAHRLDLHHRRPGAERLPDRHRRLLEQGRDPGRRLGATSTRSSSSCWRWPRC